VEQAERSRAPVQRLAASEVYVARAGILLGAIVIADSVRPEAREAIAISQLECPESHANHWVRRM